MTQAALGAAIGIKAVSVSQLESGKILPSFRTLIKLAGTFGVTMDYLAGRDLNDGNYVIPTWLAPWFPAITRLKDKDRKVLLGVTEALTFRNEAKQATSEGKP
jgi:transcriptional regulator with XRE-family HTH domain